jgi:hypothetical protein
MTETRKVRAAPEKPTVVSGTRARQGDIQHRMIRVLILSIIAAVIVLGLIYRYYFELAISVSA